MGVSRQLRVQLSHSTRTRGYSHAQITCPHLDRQRRRRPLRPQVSVCKVFIMHFASRFVTSWLLFVGLLLAAPQWQSALRAEESELVLKTATDDAKPETKGAKPETNKEKPSLIGPPCLTAKLLV